ncbi:MAG TPA: glutamine amidotransferase [Bryobacteraceae bacterium]|nr:glutamine amidotransferase [Bryobacteraceae bacterium]
MFEFLFKYPAEAFSHGQFVLNARWPAWILLALILLAAAAFAWRVLRGGPLLLVKRGQKTAVWLLQTAFVAVLLLMLWQPALSVATLRPQQNVVAVVVDDSRSMTLNDGGARRIDDARRAVETRIIPDLEKRFQVRLYRAGTGLERVASPAALKGEIRATQLAPALRQIASEAASLPVGAVVLLSDGADNSGGIDLDTTDEIRRYRVPVHTVGFGRERPEREAELADLQVPARALPGARLDARVTLRQFGMEGKRARLILKDGTKQLAAREVTLRADGVPQVESLLFASGDVGVRTVSASLQVDGDTSSENNAQSRLVQVDSTKPRILYIEGEPRWDYKFLRRALDSEASLQLVSMLRTTQNKIYRQGIANPQELEQGFPATVEELFGYHAVIIGGVEANYFTPTQLELLKQFVDRRGGGLLWLAGRGALSDGGWGSSTVSELLPTVLPTSRETFRREPATAELTPAGRDSAVCRLEDDPQRNLERWRKLPYLANYQNPGTPKPGAAVLADMIPSGGPGRMPLLVTQNYGRGRTAIFASGGSWRWQMAQPLADLSHETFWQQMLRWLVTGTHGRVVARTPRPLYSDDPAVPLRAEVRDRNYLPAADARVVANVMRPDGTSEMVELAPEPSTPGVYAATLGAIKPGSYVAEIVATRSDGEEAGRDAVAFLREEGVAENFSTNQNRELLEKLAQSTGGRYWKPADLGRLAQEVSYSESGISIRETRDLQDAPILFMAALLLRGAEWLLRRKWGVV